MRKTVLFFIFVICAAALSFISVDTNKIFADADKNSYFLEEPDGSEYLIAYPFYIVKNSEDDGIAQSYSFNKKTVPSLLAALNARLVRTEKVDGIKIACYYCDAINVSSVLGANMQLAINGSIATIGFPLILGSY